MTTPTEIVAPVSSPATVWRDVCQTNANAIGQTLDLLIARLTEDDSNCLHSQVPIEGAPESLHDRNGATARIRETADRSVGTLARDRERPVMQPRLDDGLRDGYAIVTFFERYTS